MTLNIEHGIFGAVQEIQAQWLDQELRCPCWLCHLELHGICKLAQV